MQWYRGDRSPCSGRGGRREGEGRGQEQQCREEEEGESITDMQCLAELC